MYTWPNTGVFSRPRRHFLTPGLTFTDVKQVSVALFSSLGTLDSLNSFSYVASPSLASVPLLPRLEVL